MNPGGFAYEWSAAGIGIAAAGITATVPIVVAVSAAAAAPDNNQQDNNPAAVIASKTSIAHMGDLLRVINRINRLHPILCKLQKQGSCLQPSAGNQLSGIPPVPFGKDILIHQLLCQSLFSVCQFRIQSIIGDINQIRPEELFNLKAGRFTGS